MRAKYKTRHYSMENKEETAQTFKNLPHQLHPIYTILNFHTELGSAHKSLKSTYVYEH